MALSPYFLRKIPQFDCVFGCSYGGDVDWWRKAGALGRPQSWQEASSQVSHLELSELSRFIARVLELTRQKSPFEFDVIDLAEEADE